jgi:hypothetical protein
MDCLAETAALIGRQRNHPRMFNIYTSLDERLLGTPRFLFDENAIYTSVELTLGRPTVLHDAIRQMRIPYPRLWVEWPESGRERLRTVFPREIGPDRPLPDRVGFLLEADETGRSGRATWVWAALGSTIPNVCPFATFFDLDKEFPQPSARVQGLRTNNIAQIWADNPVQIEAFLSIWRTAQVAPDGPWAEDYLIELSQRHGDEAIGYAMADIYGELIQMWCNLLLLTSSRQIVDLAPVSMAKLNKHRVKRREVPRLDHTVVTLHLDPAARERQRRAPLGHARKSPRVHLVSSYLGRRGDKHWIVQPYTRGSGETIHRQVRVQR